MSSFETSRGFRPAPRPSVNRRQTVRRPNSFIRRTASRTETEMDAERWLAHFRSNRESRPEPDWAAPITLAPTVVVRLVKSLEQFHLGDGGGPASLIAWNAESFRSSSPDARELVDLW